LSSYQVAFRDALAVAARRHGCELLIVLGRELEHIDLNERAQNEIFEWLGPTSADGVIALTGVLVNFAGPAQVLRLLERLAPTPAVSIGIELPGVPSIAIDNTAGMRGMVEHLIAVHRAERIVYIGGPPDNQEAHARLEGYRQALGSHGLRFSEELVRHGRFTLDSGQSCMRELLAAGIEIDAVVAANDYMAFGAMEVLRERGLDVPRQVRVVGFDDSPLARLAPRPLTSVAQPVKAMAERALVSLLGAIEGRAIEASSCFTPETVLRHSCGCGQLERVSRMPSGSTETSASEYVKSQRASLAQSLTRAASFANPSWRERAYELVDALSRELDGELGALALAVEALTESLPEHGLALDELGRALRQLERALDRSGVRLPVNLDALWLRALYVVSEANGRAEGRASLDLFERFMNVRYAGQRLSVSFDPEKVAEELGRSLPELSAGTACLSLVDPLEPGRLRPVLLTRGGAQRPPGAPFPKSQLIPAGLFGDDRAPIVAMPLSFEHEVYGVLALGGEATPFICEMLRTQVSAALKLGTLHRRVVEETAARERADQQKLEGEVAIARRLQLALAPKQHRVEGFEVVGSMLPAKEVGGDYYDVIATPGGAWLCIGDVTGHGLLSGLVMLMIQSMVTALVRARPGAGPAEVLCDVNRGLVPNIRERLGQEEHATLVLLRLSSDGRVRFAGAHEELIVFRQRTGRAETVETPGLWVGITPDITHETEEGEIRLEPGDSLVLYTDGLLEARNASGTELGIERLRELVEAHAPAGPEALHAALMKTALGWASIQQDDMTCLVARYQPSTE
jgi:DNA-binding LacI/PurR family transcriptional regulator/serine phosphatase RsbU (regulator of sigma subunit)